MKFATQISPLLSLMLFYSTMHLNLICPININLRLKSKMRNLKDLSKLLITYMPIKVMIALNFSINFQYRK